MSIHTYRGKKTLKRATLSPFSCTSTTLLPMEFVKHGFSTKSEAVLNGCCHFQKPVHGGPPERHMHLTPKVGQSSDQKTKQAKHIGDDRIDSIK